MARQILTLFGFDTEYSADAVEWSPLAASDTRIMAVGTYQVDKSEEDKFSPTQRKGRIYLIELHKDDDAVDKLFRLECPAVLDIKWSPNVVGGKALLATADASGSLKVYEVITTTESLSLKLACEASVVEEGLALSLEWSTRLQPSSAPKIVVSDSKGGVSVFSLTDSSELRKDFESSPMNHEFEAWVAAFDCSNESVVFSGGDDAVMKCWDTRCSRVAFVNRSHDAGVTSLQSNVTIEKRLYSGSYDEKLRSWDLRSPKRPVSEMSMGGGVWRIKQAPGGGSSSNSSLLALACMHNGFHVVDADKCESALHYTAHDSLAYGVDWKNPDVLASCSFYDHSLKVWRWNNPETSTSS